MGSTPRRLLGTGAIAVTAVVLAAVPLWDSYEDLVVEGNPAVLVALENVVSALLVACLLYAAYRLATSEFPDDDVLRIAGWSLASAVAIGFVVAWVLGIQSLQGQIKPVYVPFDAALISAIAGTGIGVYDARRRERERKLALERDRSAALFEHSSDCIAEVVYDEADPVVVDVNEAFQETFGIDADAARGRSLDELIVPDDAEDEADSINRRALEGDRFEETVERVTADGELREFLLRGIPFDPEDAVRGYAVYTDVTERSRRRERLEFLNRVLRHDLGNDVTLVAGEADLLAERVDDPGGHCAEIRDRADHMRELIEATRTLVEAIDDEDPELHPVDLGDELRTAVDDVGVEYPEATVETDGDLPEVAVRADDLLRQAFVNLLRNGIDHNDGDAPTVRASVRVDEGRAVVTVADDGPGFPDGERSPFEKGATDDEGHTGVGLYLVRTLVERYGGDVRVETADLGGAAVVLELPLAEASARDRASRSPAN